MKTVVLGGYGDMGQFAVRDLLEHLEAQVVIADYRIEGAKSFTAELGGRAAAVFVDARDEASLVQALKGADVAVGCIGPFYAYALPMVRAAIKAGVHYADLCDDYGPVDEIFGLHEAAQEAGVTVITGLGWTPGLSNLLVKKASQNLDRTEEVHIAWVGGAQDSQGLAVVKHLFYAITGDVPSYRDGKRIKVPAASGKEMVDFPPPLGKVEVFHSGHPEPLTLPRYLPLRTVTLKGGLTPRWNNRLGEFLVKLGLTSTPQRIDRLSTVIHATEKWLGAGGIPMSGVRVVAKGQKDGQAKTLTYTACDRMGRLTGIPASIGALMLARGEITQRGVFAPEGVVDTERFFPELARRGIQVQEA